MDYWAVDFDYMQRKEIIKVPKSMGVEGYSLPQLSKVLFMLPEKLKEKISRERTGLRLVVG